jgi:hypothetical protein
MTGPDGGSHSVAAGHRRQEAVDRVLAALVRERFG